MNTAFNVKTATAEELIREIRVCRRALNRDFKDAAIKIPKQEIRYLVDLYYTAQEMRVAVEGKLRSIADEPYLLNE